MTRKTVTITTPDSPEPRQFHLSEDRAEQFATKVRAEGGTAIVSSLNLGADLAARLLRSGIEPKGIR